MDTHIALHHLGQNVLVVMESAPRFLDTLRSVVVTIPQVSEKFFTLIGCCPPRYWEHGGADNPEVREEIANAWREELAEAHHAEECMARAQAVLEAAGVPKSHVSTKLAVDAEVTPAIMRELRACRYTGVIVSRYHGDLINRLMKKGVTDVFRQIPTVEVLAIDVD